MATIHLVTVLFLSGLCIASALDFVDMLKFYMANNAAKRASMEYYAHDDPVEVRTYLIENSKCL